MVLTVNDLAKFVVEQIKKGNGDKEVLISNDIEGNGCHPLCYEFIDAQNNYEEVVDMLSMECDGTHTPENCVILG